VAREYFYYGAAELGTDELRSLVAGAVGGIVTADGLVARDVLIIAAERETPGEEASAPRLFGFTHRITVLFRFSNRLPELEEHDTALMIGAVLAILDRTGADGVLLFDGEEAILQTIGSEPVFDDDWEGWEELPEAAALKAGRRVARPPQPLL
jgi:hypothetical protein